ncbi:ribosomal protein L7/L12 [Planotetraspora thailandica]
MFALGWPEMMIFLLIALLVVILLVVLVAAARTGARPDTSLGWRSPGLAPAISADLQKRVRELQAAGKKIEAIKIIRAETGIGLKEAKAVADSLAAGRPVPEATPSRLDLASRVRELKAAGRTEQAIFLVRGETGMGQEEAEAFINAL